MGKVYHILLIEDEESDADLIEIELNKLDLEVQLDVISTKEEVLDRLDNNLPDLIISDYNLPSLIGTEALKIVRENHPNLPFILVSGFIGEEKAVDAMLEGASDYAMKQNLDRLGPAILREIANYEEHKQQNAALKKTRNRYESLVQSVNGIVWEADAETFEFTYISPQAKKILGYSPDEWLTTPNFWEEHIHPDDREKALNYCRTQTEKGQNHSFEYRIIDAEDEAIWMRDYVTVLVEDGEPDRLRGFMVDISSEKKAERQRDEAYKIANIGHWDLDLVNEELYWSDTVKKLHEVELDYEPDLDTAINFYKEGEYRQQISNAVEKAIETGKPFDLELKIITAEGNERWVRAVGETEFRNGECVRIFGSTQNITARKEIEQKLRGVVEHSTNMFYRHDTDHVLSYVSPQSTEFLGCSPEEAKQRWTEFATDHPVNEEGFENTQRAIKTGKAQPSFPLQLQKNNGDTIWVRVNEAPIVEDGETIAIVGSLTDITEQKKYEEDLRQSLERYEYVTKATSDAIWDWDLKKDAVFWGQGFKQLFGHDPEALANDSSSWTNHIHPDDLEWVQDGIYQTIQGDKQNWFEEYRYLKADGSYAFVEDRGFVIRDDDGEAVRMIGAMRDITEGKQIEIQNTLKHEILRFFKTDKTLDNILQNTLQYLANFGEFNTAEIWLTSVDQKHQNLIATHASDHKGNAFYNNSEHINQFVRGEGLPGTVWEADEVKIWQNIDTNDSFIRNEAAQKAGLKSAIGIPFYHNEDMVGVLLCGNSSNLEYSATDIGFYKGLQRFLGAEIKRKQQEEELQLLFESAPDLLALAAPNKQFVTVNPAFCEVLGYTEEELTSQPYENFVHPDDLHVTKKEYQETISGERQANNFVNRWKTKDGDYRWLSWSSSEVFGEDNLVFSYARDITEQKNLEELLQQTNRLAKVGSWELDLTGEVDGELYWSEMIRNILEVDDDYQPTLEEGIDFYTQETKGKVERAIKKAIEEGMPFDQELLVKTAKGNERWVRSIGRPEIVDGECVRVYGSYQDIHDRKTSELELEQRNKFIETIMDNLPIGIAVHYIDSGQSIFTNKKFCEIYGWPSEELTDVDTFFEKVFPDPKHREKIKSRVGADMESGDPERMQWTDLKITTQEGEQRTIDAKNIPLPDQNQMISTVIDVTAEKKAEEEKLKTLERVDDAFLAVNENWTVTFWNTKAEELLETPRENVIGKNIWGIFDDEIAHEFKERYYEAMEKQKTVQTEEYYPLVDKWFESSAYPSESGLSVYFRDITERKKSRQRLKELYKQLEERAEQLETTNEELEQFAYVASHDLQEPLRMVSSFLNRLEEKYHGQLDDKAQQYIDFAVDGAQRMRRIILDLLNYSRMNQHELEREEIDLDTLLKDIVKMDQSAINESNASINWDDLPNINAARTPIRQVFENLINNGIKYRKSDVAPEITITAKDKNDYWQFSVSDNGIGIKEEFQDNIFTIFKRLHTQDEYSGTGIGLSVSQKIVEKHGGEIWVESQEGKGSTFHFTIPKE